MRQVGFSFTGLVAACIFKGKNGKPLNHSMMTVPRKMCQLQS